MEQAEKRGFRLVSTSFFQNEKAKREHLLLFQQKNDEIGNWQKQNFCRTLNRMKIADDGEQ